MNHPVAVTVLLTLFVIEALAAIALTGTMRAHTPAMAVWSVIEWALIGVLVVYIAGGFS